MSIEKSEEIVNAGAAVIDEARQALIAQGLSNDDAEAKVQKNFHRINNTPTAILSVEELCK